MNQRHPFALDLSNDTWNPGRTLLIVVLLLGCLLPTTTLAMPPVAASSSSSPSPITESVLKEVQSGISDATNSIKQLMTDMRQHSTLAGGSRFQPILHKLHLTSQDYSRIWTSLSKTVHLEDLALFSIVGWLSVPVVRLPYQQLPDHLQQALADYYISLQFALDHFQQVARIAVLVYAVDILKMICIGLGFEFIKMESFPHAFAQTAYTIWGANRLLALKRYRLHKFVSTHPETFGRMQVVNKLLDAAIGAVTAGIVLSILKIQMGVVLAFGSVGTLAVGLASQGIAKEILNGLMLASSDRIYEGDMVSFGHNKQVEGKIVKLGWMETVIRGSDDVLWSIPNTSLVNQPVSNLSRVRLSQVHQTLRFKYQDTANIPALIESIKQHVQLSCPKLITDGSRPFRVHWTEFGSNHLEVVVDCHFRIRPVGDKYWDNRQRVLQAIDAAVKKSGLEFKA